MVIAKALAILLLAVIAMDSTSTTDARALGPSPVPPLDAPVPAPEPSPRRTMDICQLPREPWKCVSRVLLSATAWMADSTFRQASTGQSASTTAFKCCQFASYQDSMVTSIVKP